MDFSRALLPPLGTPPEELLSEYSGHLLYELRRAQVAPAIVREVEATAQALRSVVEARKVCMRLSARAEALAEAAELDTEREIRALHDALSAEVQPLDKLFPHGIGDSLAPRGEGQVLEVQRLLAASDSQTLAPSVASALVRLGIANAALASRLAASVSAHEALLAVITAEQRHERTLRQRYRWAFGALTGMFHDDPAKVERFFRSPPELALPDSLPAPPPPSEAAELHSMPDDPEAREDH